MQAVYQRHIQLDIAGRNGAHAVKAGIPGAKVVNGNFKLLALVVTNGSGKGGKVGDVVFFGDFKNNVIAQAKALRALAHFEVARTYAEIPTQAANAASS